MPGIPARSFSAYQAETQSAPFRDAAARLTAAILADRGRRELFLALSDTRDQVIAARLAAWAGGAQAARPAAWQDGYTACDDEWVASFDDAHAYARILARSPGHARLETARYGPPWQDGPVPAAIRHPRARRRWLARHPAWNDTAARSAWAARPRAWSPALAPAQTADRRDAAAHERAFIARAYTCPGQYRTEVQAAAVRLYPPPDAP